MTRLKPAIALDEYQDTVSGFGDRESRQARREARRSRRQTRRQERRERRQDKRTTRKEARTERRADRQGQRQEKRLERVNRQQATVREKLATTAPAPGRRGLLRRTAEPTLEPAPGGPPQPPAWLDDGWDMAEDVLDAELEPEEADEDGAAEADDDAATEGIGAWRPLRRGPPPLRRGTTPSTPVSAATPNGAWGPSVRMGRALRIQAAAGHRAAVIDLKPGLFLVAELPDAVTRTEFGLAPVLAPLMVTAARRALDEPPRERRGPLAALFRRRREPVVRYVEVQPPHGPLALPGPVATDAPMVVPAPNVGWADDATVAAAYGCDGCARGPR